MSDITYTDPAAVTEVIAEPVAPTYGRSASGYGSKIPTRHKIRIGGRLRRVYVMLFGNSGSAYVVVDGVDTFLDVDTEHRLEEI